MHECDTLVFALVLSEVAHAVTDNLCPTNHCTGTCFGLITDMSDNPPQIIERKVTRREKLCPREKKSIQFFIILVRGRSRISIFINVY